LAVTVNHLLADTASCVQLVERWGQAMMKRQQHKNSSSAEDNITTTVCWNRAKASTTGMMTVEKADLLGISTTMTSNDDSLAWNWIGRCYSEFFGTTNEVTNKVLPKAPKHPLTDHEYVPLHFSVAVLTAMKAHGMAACVCHDDDGDEEEERVTYVSTNDMVTAAGWLMKRCLSKRPHWNLSCVVNLRGRCGVEGFTACSSTKKPTRGLFGNAICNVVAELEPTTCMNIANVGAAAHSVRRALIRGLSLDIPYRMAQSLSGRTVVPSAPSSIDTFCTTSWAQLSPWNI
jgi:hypothetical protein